MNWDPVEIKQGKKDRAKTELKSAIKSAMESGLLYEDLIPSHKSFGLSLQDLYQRYKVGESVMYFSLGDLTKTDFEARMIAMLGDYISPKYEPFAYKYGLGKGIIGNFATHYVVGDIHINNFKKAFPENRRIYSFALGRYI